MEYSFQVAQPDSHYRVKVEPSAVYVAYTGTFLVDPGSADVVQMTITTGDLPLATGLCMSTTAMDFARVRIGDGQFLLAKQARERFVYPNAEETQNTIGFTNCREFRGNSTVTFFAGAASEAVADDSAKHGAANARSLPDGLAFSLELTAAIATGTAAAGDPFAAKLAGPIRDGRKVLAPAGTVVEGHLTRVQSFFRPLEVLIALRPEALWIGGAKVPVSATRDWTPVVAESRRKGQKSVEIFMPLAGEGNSGVFRFSGGQVVVPSGFRSEWKTVSEDVPGKARPKR
jgi:hypothetical protein